MKNKEQLPVAIIGAGPVGLAAAAHLTIRGIPFILFETGDTVASNVLSWKHVRIFSPWQYNIDKAAASLLLETNWVHPHKEDLPTGGELYNKYLKPLSTLPVIKPSIHLNSKVMSIGRQNFNKLKTRYREQQPFELQVEHKGKGFEFYQARAIIDASGSWNQPNPIGSGGYYAYGEVENFNRILYGIPDVLGKDKDRYKNKCIAVVGSGHSSINTLLDLAKLKDRYPGTIIKWIIRKENLQDVYGGKEKDALQARGTLGIRIEQLVNEETIEVYNPFHIEELHLIDYKLVIIGRKYEKRAALHDVDEVISNTGSRPDLSILREIRLNVDPAIESATGIADLIDPNIHSCGTVRPHGEKELKHLEKDFYIVGAKSYGRAPTFLMATGYEQVRSIAAALAGDWEAAEKVELELPETGVCSTERVGCCGTNALESEVQSCCS